MQPHTNHIVVVFGQQLSSKSNPTKSHGVLELKDV